MNKITYKLSLKITENRNNSIIEKNSHKRKKKADRFSFEKRI